MIKAGVIAALSAMASVMLVTGCAGDKDMEQEQLSVKAQFEQLEATHQARTAILEGLDDKALAQLLWQEQSSNYYSMLNLIPFHMSPGEFQYTQPWLLRLEDYVDVADLTDTYVQSLLAFTSYDHPQCMRYADSHGFKLSQGFELPFRHDLYFSQITFEDGTTLEIPDVANNQRETADMVHTDAGYCFKAHLTDDDPQPLSIRGEFHADLPTDLLEFEFTADDVGKTAEQGGYVVTLLEFENERYVIEVDAEEDTPMNFGTRDILAEAVDAHGQYIAWRARSEVGLEWQYVIDSQIAGISDNALLLRFALFF